jgi:enoyl-CoA hydratase/carnithine racemase
MPIAKCFVSQFFHIEKRENIDVLRLASEDGANRLKRACVLALTDALRERSRLARPLVIAGNEKFFSAGADLGEIAQLSGPAAYQFSKIGQELMSVVAGFPAPVCAVINGYCMGGGLDLALACDRRIASANAVFGHRGAALGLITGWGGTQRLPRLIGRARALELFVTAEKIDAEAALRFGLVAAVVEDPLSEAVRRLEV